MAENMSFFSLYYDANKPHDMISSDMTVKIDSSWPLIKHKKYEVADRYFLPYTKYYSETQIDGILRPEKQISDSIRFDFQKQYLIDRDMKVNSWEPKTEPQSNITYYRDIYVGDENSKKSRKTISNYGAMSLKMMDLSNMKNKVYFNGFKCNIRIVRNNNVVYGKINKGVEGWRVNLVRLNEKIDLVWLVFKEELRANKKGKLEGVTKCNLRTIFGTDDEIWFNNVMESDMYTKGHIYSDYVENEKYEDSCLGDIELTLEMKDNEFSFFANIYDSDKSDNKLDNISKTYRFYQNPNASSPLTSGASNVIREEFYMLQPDWTVDYRREFSKYDDSDIYDHDKPNYEKDDKKTLESKLEFYKINAKLLHDTPLNITNVAMCMYPSLNTYEMRNKYYPYYEKLEEKDFYVETIHVGMSLADSPYWLRSNPIAFIDFTRSIEKKRENFTIYTTGLDAPTYPPGSDKQVYIIGKDGDRHKTFEYITAELKNSYIKIYYGDITEGGKDGIEGIPIFRNLHMDYSSVNYGGNYNKENMFKFAIRCIDGYKTVGPTFIRIVGAQQYPGPNDYTLTLKDDKEITETIKDGDNTYTIGYYPSKRVLLTDFKLEDGDEVTGADNKNSLNVVNGALAIRESITDVNKIFYITPGESYWDTDEYVFFPMIDKVYTLKVCALVVKND